MKRRMRRVCTQHLRGTFRLDAYRPGQKQAAYSLLSGRDVFCVLPTGAGKSLCWQLPAVVHAGLTVVVSPLIALMQDQVMHLAALGIKAETINSLKTNKEQQQAVLRLLSGEARIVFVAPERLRTNTFLQLCRACRPWLVVVDEAHCVVQWGEEFRPAYREISAFISELPHRPVLCAMTATADSEMRAAIATGLRLSRPRFITMPVIRENLVYNVRTTLDKTPAILELLRESDGKTVIFCRSRARTEQLSRFLQAEGYDACFYHAGMDRNSRDEMQRRFQDGRCQILTATTAFGMGVDIPDIRLVIHDYLPDNLIDYVQQSGRAGRDRQTAACILLIEPRDIVTRSHKLYWERKRLRWHCMKRMQLLKKEWKPFRQLLKAVLASKCIPAAISRTFGRSAARCGRCSCCNGMPLLKRIPYFPAMSGTEMTAFFLRWQRNAIAHAAHLREKDILDDWNLIKAARRLYIPAEASPYSAEFDRLLKYFLHLERHTF